MQVGQGENDDGAAFGNRELVEVHVGGTADVRYPSALADGIGQGPVIVGLKGVGDGLFSDHWAGEL